LRRLFCSFLRARLGLARGIGSLLLALLLHGTVRLLALPLPFSHVAIRAALPLLALDVAVMLAFPLLTWRVLIELLAGTMLALLSHHRLRQYRKACAKSSNKTKIS